MVVGREGRDGEEGGERSAATAAAAAAAAAGTTAAEPAAAAAAAVATAAAAAAVLTLLSLVDREATATEVEAVEGLDRGLGLAVAVHLDERETAGTPGLAVFDDANLPDAAARLEEGADL